MSGSAGPAGATRGAGFRLLAPLLETLLLKTTAARAAWPLRGAFGGIWVVGLSFMRPLRGLFGRYGLRFVVA